MGIRIQKKIYDQNGQDWTIKVHDTAYGGGVLDCEIIQAKLNYNPDSAPYPHLAPIVFSNAVITLRVETSIINTFVTDFIGAAENRFYLQIDKGSSMEWGGPILTDNVEKENKEYPYKFTFKATDGLGTLKDLNYNNSGTAYSGLERCTDHVINCLGRLPHTSIYTNILSTSSNWFSAEHVNTTIDPLYAARFEHRRFIKLDTSGTKTYYNCLDVLRSICRAWNARLVQTGGNYKIITINRYEGASLDFHHYQDDKSANGTAAAATKRATASSDVYELFGSKFTYQSALNYATVKYKHFQTQSVIPTTGITLTASTYETLDSGSGTNTLYLYFKNKYKANFTSGFETCFVKSTIKVQVGSKYLKRTVTFTGSGGYTYSPVTWENSSSSVVEVISGPITVNNTYSYTNEQRIEAPAIPADGTLEILGNALSVHDLIGNSLSATPTINFYDAYLEVVPAGTIESRANIDIYTTDNDTANNTAAVKLDTEIGDADSLNALGALSVHTGSSWVASTGWELDGTSGTIEFSKLHANEIVKTQAKPMEVSGGTYYGTYTYINSLYRNSKDHIPGNVSIDLIKARSIGNWIQIDSTGASVTPRTKEPVFETDEQLSPLTPTTQTGREQKIISDVKLASIADSLIPITTDTAITSGASVSSIAIVAPGEDDIILNGDDIRILDPSTGLFQTFSVTSDVAASDTSISVTTQTASYDFGAGAIIQLTQKEILKKINALNGASYTSWTARTDDLNTQAATDGYILDFLGTNGIETSISSGNVNIGLDNSVALWTQRTDDGATEDIFPGGTLDFDGGNGLKTTGTGGDVNIQLDGSTLLTGFGIDKDDEVWVFDGSTTNQRYTLEEAVSTGFFGFVETGNGFYTTSLSTSRAYVRITHSLGTLGSNYTAIAIAGPNNGGTTRRHTNCAFKSSNVGSFDFWVYDVETGANLSSGESIFINYLFIKH